MLTPAQYLKVLELGFPLSPPPFVTGLCGRIIRGKTPEDFAKLSDDPSRKIVFLTDAGGLASMLGKSGYQMLITVGHHPDHIAKQVAAGKTYKIVVFPASEAQPATWEGLCRSTAEVYPDLKSDMQKYFDEFQTLSFKDWEQKFQTQMGTSTQMKDVDDPSSFNFMSYDKYVASPRTALDLRRFFYHTLHIRELFRGDGYTYDENGRRGVKEYLMPNKAITDIKDAVVGDVSVTIPTF